jgi:phage N-6-adenine-methyltransferase
MVAGIPRNNVSTDKNEWCTPIDLYNKLDSEFHFTIDAACKNGNCLCPYGFFHEVFHEGEPPKDALKLDWLNQHDVDGKLLKPNIFLNPPYGRGVIKEFVRKAYLESTQGAVVVCLLPFSGASWFTDYCLHAAEIRILGRVKYIGFAADGTLIKNSPTFDSCVVIFKPGYHEAKLSKFMW